MTTEKLLCQATEKLKKHKLANPRFEAELLLALATGKPRETILAYPEIKLSLAEQQAFKKLVARRAKHEPFSYLSGQKEFLGLDFLVTPATLIPRPETELLVEQAVQTISQLKAKKLLIADIGTGSGCIAISTAKLLEKAGRALATITIAACDLSASALKVCQKNLARHSLTDKILALQGDLLEPVIKSGLLAGQEALVVLANLPYLSSQIYQDSPQTVRDFEPKSALYSPAKGLTHYRKLLRQLAKIKAMQPKLKIWVFCEISPEQKKLFPQIVAQTLPQTPSNLEYFKDLAGKWRLVKLEIPSL